MLLSERNAVLDPPRNGQAPMPLTSAILTPLETPTQPPATEKQRSRLNDLSAKEWIKFTKSWFTLPSRSLDKKKAAAHPATFPKELAEDFIGFFTRQGEKSIGPLHRLRHHPGIR